MKIKRPKIGKKIIAFLIAGFLILGNVSPAMAATTGTDPTDQIAAEIKKIVESSSFSAEWKKAVNDGIAATQKMSTKQKKQYLDALLTAVKNEKKRLSSDSNPTKSVTNFGEIASLIVSVFTPIVAISAEIAGNMMDNDFIIGTAFSEKATQKPGEKNPKKVTEMKEVLLAMWRLMRDLVNYAFILVLLVIAFMTVIDAGGHIGGGDNAFLKQALPKLVIGLVGVNLTWFFGMVILDVANVTTHIVYGLPQSLPGVKNAIIENEKNCKFFGTGGKNEKPCTIVVAKNGIQLDAENFKNLSAKDLGKKIEKLASEKSTDAQNGTETVSYKWGTLIFRRFDWNDFNENSIASLFAFGVLHVEQLPMSVDRVNTMWDLAIHSVVALLVMILIIIAMLALTFALIERVIVIWLNLILSPVGVLMWVLGSFGASPPSGLEEKGIGFTSFLRAAFMPAAVGAPLSIGFILIIFGKGSTGDIASNINDLGAIVPGVHTLHQLFWFVIAIGVMWSSVSIAESLTNYVKPAISSMKEGVEKVVSFALKSPMFLPWIPVATGKNGETKNVSFLGGVDAIDRKLQNISLGLKDRDYNTLFHEQNPPGITREIADEIRANRDKSSHILDELERRNLDGQIQFLSQNGFPKLAAAWRTMADADRRKVLAQIAGNDKDSRIDKIIKRAPRAATPTQSVTINNQSITVNPDADAAAISDQIEKALGGDKTISESEIKRNFNFLSKEKINEIIEKLRSAGKLEKNSSE